MLLSYSKPDLHIMSNKLNSQFFDQFFKYATYLGDGVMVAVITIILLFVKYRYAVVFLLASLTTSGLVQLFKRVFLENMHRPSSYFKLNLTYELHLIEGVNLHTLNSFPSGHSATAFNVFMMLAILVHNRLLKLLFFFMAGTVAYSRVYLSQHFLIDITVGSFLGTLFIILFYLWGQRWKKDWNEKSLLNNLSR